MYTNDNKIYNSLITKYSLAHWFSDNAFLFVVIVFCWTLVSTVNLWPWFSCDFTKSDCRWMLGCHWLMRIVLTWTLVGFSLSLKDRMNVKQWRCMQKFHLFISDEKRLLGWWGHSFQILEEYFLNFLCHSQCNDYRQDTLLGLICIINILSITF